MRGRMIEIRRTKKIKDKKKTKETEKKDRDKANFQ